MKNLTNRNKIVLAIVGVLVIVVIAVAAFAQVGGGQLFGTTVSLVINPAGNPLSLPHGHSLTLSVANGDPTCKWSLPPNLVSLESSSGASISVIGGSVGMGPVNAVCNTGVGAKLVMVVPAITPSNPSVVLDGNVQFSTSPSTNCIWRVGNTAIATISGSNTGSSVTVVGIWPWTTSISATCPTGTSSTNLSITEPQHYPGYVEHVSPEHGTVQVGHSIVYVGYGQNCNWSSSNTSVATVSPYGNSYSALANGHAAGTTTLTASCSLGTYSAALLVVP